MKRIYVNLLVVVLVLLMGSCSPLRKSQVRLIGNYYNTLANYPGNVRKLNERVAKLELESDNLQSALYPSDSARVYALVEAINQYEINITLPDSILAQVDFLEDYIRGYYVLVPNGFNVYKAFKGTTESIVGIFGFRSVASSVLPDKNVEVTNAKERKILVHFRGQSPELRACLVGIKAYIDNHAVPEIDRTNKRIQEGVRGLFKDENEAVSSRDHYFTYNRHFIDFFLKTIQTRKLYLNISESLTNILETEKEIQKMTAERMKIDRDSYQLHILATDVLKMKSLLEESEF
ncbi:MAG: hypothetical protein ABJP45_04480 [Cyclobacteriaceae bacterium]